MSFLLSIWPYVIFCFIVGTFIGSFLLTVATRVPQNESMKTRSHCPYCNHNLGVFDLVPIFSYLFLRGKCRYCGHKIPVYYLLIELLTGAVYAFLGWKFGISWFFLKYAVLSSFVITITLSDLMYGVIPDIIVIIGGLFGLVFAVITGDFVVDIAGSIVLGGMFLIIYLITKRRGMGDGDVTTAFAVGLYFDVPSALLVFMLSFLIGAVVGVIIYFKDKDGEKAVPFAPFVSIASFIVAVYSYQIFSFIFNGFLFK